MTRLADVRQSAEETQLGTLQTGNQSSANRI